MMRIKHTSALPQWNEGWGLVADLNGPTSGAGEAP